MLAEIPMSRVSREKRGMRTQEIGLAIDRRLHPSSQFSLMKGSKGHVNASADWVRGGMRVELKSSLMWYSTKRDRWECRFNNIKSRLFDELWLAINSHFGIHFYRSSSPERLRFWAAGVATQHSGLQQGFSGPCGEFDPMNAFKIIEAKIISKGFEPVALVTWDKRGPTQHIQPHQILQGNGKDARGIFHCKYTVRSFAGHDLPQAEPAIASL